MSSTTPNNNLISGKGYRYCQEIGQMCFVFTKLNEIDQQVLIQIEQIIKFQLIQLIIKATSSSSSSSRQLTIQNILFILRKDNQKLHRLINHLASNNVTKKLKDDEPDDAIHSIQDPDIDKLSKAFERRDRIPWRPTNVYAEHLKDLSDSEDDLTIEIDQSTSTAKRFKMADDYTRNMSIEQYQHYAECRQASFTHRKAKRFREFINLNAYTDGTTSDEVIDVLGFLACEMVRSLCDAGALSSLSAGSARSKVQRVRLEEAAVSASNLAKTEEKKRKRAEKASALEEKKVIDKEVIPNQGGAEARQSTVPIDPHAIPTTKVIPMSEKGGRFEAIHPARSPPRILIEPSSLFSEPVDGLIPSPLVLQPPLVSPFAPAAEKEDGITEAVKEGTFRLEDIIGGYETLLDDQSTLRSCGFRNWRKGNIKKRRLTLI